MMKKEKSTFSAEKNAPVLMQGIQLISKLTELVKENIPERIVFAKGAGAHGYFRPYMPMSDFTKAAFLMDPDKITPVFVRFSTMTGSKGSADTLRDVRGFAVKFYTTEGNYDLLSISLPVFFIRDALHFPKLMNALKPSPDTNITDPERFWRYISETPETIHAIIWLFSNRGTVKSYRHMEGFSINTYIWTSPNGKRHLVRYYWKPLQGIKNILRQEAEFLAGFDPDVAARELCDSLGRGEVTEFELNVQMIPYENKNKYDFDLLDSTKLWPEKKVPYIKVGKLTLDKSTDNYFQEVEKAAFSPANIVPGIEFSNDQLLQGSIFGILVAQRHRLGTDFNQIPINQAKYSIDNEVIQQGFMESVEAEEKGGRYQEHYEDDFKQAGESYRFMHPKDQDYLVNNIMDHLMFVDDGIKEKVVSYFMKADNELGTRIMRGLDF
jgi:catalase